MMPTDYDPSRLLALTTILAACFGLEEPDEFR